MAGRLLLLLLWPAPAMTAGRLLLAVSMTAYMVVGLWFEERDLVASFGERYRAYRRRVPGLVPGWTAVAGLYRAARGAAGAAPGERRLTARSRPSGEAG